MKRSIFLFIWLMCQNACTFAQGLYPYPQPILPPYINSGNHVQNCPSPYSINYTVTSTASLTVKSGTEITMLAGSDVYGLTGGGNFVGKIEDDCGFAIGAFPDWNPSKLNKWEVGVRIPADVQAKINTFLSGGTGGLNPYDPDQVKVECTFQHYHFNDSYTRYGFYYRDYTVSNNTWVEQPTVYTYRVRFAPPTDGIYYLTIKLTTPDSVYQTCMQYLFNVSNTANKGHLKMANGNLLKMQFTNGDMFFGVGQNIPYAEKQNVSNCAGGYCASHASYETQRGYINDLADNGGDFTRIRLDAWSNVVEWPYSPILSSDPVINKPLSQYLNNYDLNQRQMWELDRTFDVLEARKVYAILCLLEDQNYMVDSDYDGGHTFTWNNNPYSALLGNNEQGCKNFFSNPTAKNYYRKQLYYIMARWGYSTSLAMWEMINETVNVANTSTHHHQIDTDPVFNNNVKNWVCDMKFYLEQYYPWHPTTTGFVSDNNAKNIAYGCLNVWSSNSYVGDLKNGKFFDENYNSRANTELGAMNANIAGYFPNNKPFFWGEMGLGDAINFIDDKSDRAFHNAIWASAVTGGISNGLYWNDWSQKYGVNHRYNFNALRLFTDMIDFTQRLEPDKHEDAGLTQTQYANRLIDTYWMRNGAKNYIVGWAKNYSANWTQDYSTFNSSEQSAIVSAGYNGTLVDYTCFATNQNPQITIDNLLGTTKYKIKIYDTYNFATLLETRNEWTGVGGTLTFRRKMPSSPNNPFYPDYAFIIRTASSSRFSNVDRVSYDTLSITEADTICFQNNEIPHYDRYQITWDLGDRVSDDTLQCLHYSKNGTYEVTVTARSNDNDSVLVYKHYIVVSDLRVEKSVGEVVAFPIPANNSLNLDYDTKVIVNPEIEVFDCVGRKQPLFMLNSTTINTSRFENGVYFLKFKYSNYEKTIKFNILH